MIETLKPKTNSYSKRPKDYMVEAQLWHIIVWMIVGNSSMDELDLC
jgi:diacylglycerol kinase